MDWCIELRGIGLAISAFDGVAPCSRTRLGSAIPLNGGSQAYLQYSYGPGERKLNSSTLLANCYRLLVAAAFMYAWTSITAVKVSDLMDRNALTDSHSARKCQ